MHDIVAISSAYYLPYRDAHTLGYIARKSITECFGEEKEKEEGKEGGKRE